MTQKEKFLLLKEISARLPFGVKCNVGDNKPYTLSRIEIDEENGHLLDFIEMKNGLDMQVYLSEVKPYLIPLSSIREELKNFIRWKLTTPKYDSFDEESLEDLFNNNMQVVQFCYEHHLDINGLIERGLALEAPEGMYN
mgnify:CR=1 FL=1